jgi:small GTP-binding protein
MLQKKICMLGSFSVGKTSLVRRFVESKYSEVYHTTIGVKVDKKVVQSKDQDIALLLWDMYGDDAFQKIRMPYLRGMSGYLLVVDGTRLQTLEDALALNERILNEPMLAESGRIPSILVFNKSDLADKWEIDSARESELAAAGWTIVRTSAKTGDSVEEVFLKLAAAMLAE